MTKAKRKTAHEVINMLSHAQIEAIVRKHNPRAKAEYVNQRAKQLIAELHRFVSPRKTPTK